MQWQQTFYTLSSTQSCETVIVLLKATGTPDIIPRKKKEKTIRKVAAWHTQLQMMISTDKDKESQVLPLSTWTILAQHVHFPRASAPKTDVFKVISCSTQIINSYIQPPERNHLTREYVCSSNIHPALEWPRLPARPPICIWLKKHIRKDNSGEEQ